MSLIVADSFPTDELGRYPPVLGAAQRAQIAAALWHLLPEWSIELTEGLAGRQSIMISPDDGEDTSGPTLIVCYRDGWFCLDAFQWDRYWTVGEYKDWSAVLRAVRMTTMWENVSPHSIH